MCGCGGGEFWRGGASGVAVGGAGGPEQTAETPRDEIDLLMCALASKAHGHRDRQDKKAIKRAKSI